MKFLKFLGIAVGSIVAFIVFLGVTIAIIAVVYHSKVVSRSEAICSSVKIGGAFDEAAFRERATLSEFHFMPSETVKAGSPQAGATVFTAMKAFPMSGGAFCKIYVRDGRVESLQTSSVD